MRVKWAENAKEGRDQIADYIRRQFGNNRRIAFLQEVRYTINLLKRNPYIGHNDPLFAHHVTTYRSMIINGLSKFAYSIDNETIYIVAFWDTRMEPEEQAAKVM